MERFVKDELGLGYGFIVASHIGGMESDEEFYKRVRATLDEYPYEGGVPDHFALMSWYHHPVRALPEDAPTDAYPMTKIGLDFGRKLRGIEAPRRSAEDAPNVILASSRSTTAGFSGLNPLMNGVSPLPRKASDLRTMAAYALRL